MNSISTFRAEEPSIFKRLTFSSIGSSSGSPLRFLRLDSEKWGTTDRTVGDTANNIGPYVRRRSGVSVSESTPSTLIRVTGSLPAPTTNATVTASSNAIDDSKRRTNRDEEAEAERKHRSAQAGRERHSTQSVTVEDIKTAEQQIKSRSNDTNELSNNKIDAPSTPSANNEHYTETARLQKSHRINTRVTLTEDIPTITANGSLNLPESQQQRGRTNRVHNQRKNTGRIIWNDETKEVEIREDSKSKEASDDQQSVAIGPHSLISRFENNATTKINRSQSQEPSQKSLPSNGMNSNNDPTMMKLYENIKRKMEELIRVIRKLSK